MLKQTPLYQKHIQLDARMIDFGGWSLPVQYKGVVAEHMQTRNMVSLFDVSHMGEFFVEGPDAEAQLQRLLPNDISKIKIGQVQYNFLLYENGTFVDDLTVYKMAEERYMLCVNASNTQKDFDWIKANIKGDVKFSDKSPETGQIAIQGKKSQDVLQKLVDFPLDQIAYYHFNETSLLNHPCVIARMGYTGGIGFEIFCEWNQCPEIWDALLDKGKEFEIQPAGLGARDTLRLEAGFPLYGNDLDDQHNPLQANLLNFISFDKFDFIGKEALQNLKNSGISQTFIRFVLEEKGIPRAHYQILDYTTGDTIGEVTSGNYSPMLEKGIGMGYVKTQYQKPGTKIRIRIRNSTVNAVIVKGPFTKLTK
ncbi:MAG: glycine cleavage system aminomethyltransferase GcvT [Deltaproteobacteria bacterium]|nr:glycine cleavage system aminomethyltransferase GcvT [Deltaproteobacteria bacterium]